MSGRALAGSIRLYRVLIFAYPAAFRRTYADEMLWVFECCCVDALEGRGLGGLAGLWLRVLPDWGLSVIKERLLQAGYRGANQMDTTPFNQQFTSTLALFSRALRGGYSVKQTLEIVARHAPEPTRSVFQRALDRIEKGENTADAINAMTGEMPSSYLRQAIEAMMKQRETGGNLADILDALNRTIYAELGDQGWAKQIDLEDGYDLNADYPLN